MHAAASAFHTCRQLALLTAASLVLGCSLDDHPSLGHYGPAATPAANPPAGDVASTGPMSPVVATGGARAPTPVATSADSGSPLAAPELDAAAPGADSGPIDAAGVAQPSCEGVYKGDFICTVNPPVTTPSTATTPLALTLKRAQGAAVASANASLSFTFAGFVFAGDVTGQLDCSTNLFHADIVNGILAAELAPIPLPFTGTIDGALNRTTNDLGGSWSFTGPGGGTCAGTWGAALQP